jgi:hypothetical protein
LHRLNCWHFLPQLAFFIPISSDHLAIVLGDVRTLMCKECLHGV